jgi:hypothetical protein
MQIAGLALLITMGLDKDRNVSWVVGVLWLAAHGRLFHPEAGDGEAGGQNSMKGPVQALRR